MLFKLSGIAVFLITILFITKTKIWLDVMRIVELNTEAAIGDPRPKDLVKTYFSFFYKLVMTLCLFLISIILLFVPLK